MPKKKPRGSTSKNPRGKPVNIPVDFDRAMDVFANEPPPPDKKKGGKGKPSKP